MWAVGRPWSEARLALRVEAQPAAVAREADAARVDADVPAARAAPRDARRGVQGVQPVGLDGFERRVRRRAQAPRDQCCISSALGLRARGSGFVTRVGCVSTLGRRWARAR